MSTENKYCYWMLTVQRIQTENFDDYYNLPSTGEMIQALKKVSERWLFQLEEGETKKEHYQGCFKTPIRKRMSTVLKELTAALELSEYRAAQIQLEPMNGSWEQAKAYCSKQEGSLGVVYTNDVVYSGSDIVMLDDPSRRFHWQNEILDKILDESSGRIKDADDREIVWVWDPQGGSGKSKFVKFCCIRFDHITKVSFGTSNQLRSALISAGPHKIYFIDVPRTLGSDDSIASLLSCIEDLKNGHVISAMYGKHQQMFLDSPHIIIFSNQECPQQALSQDRWAYYMINHWRDLVRMN